MGEKEKYCGGLHMQLIDQQGDIKIHKAQEIQL